LLTYLTTNLRTHSPCTHNGVDPRNQRVKDEGKEKATWRRKADYVG
jgi:hypothetical protein